MREIQANIPEVFEFLFFAVRYKVCFGGRGSGKSWQISRVLIIKSVQKKQRNLCTREIQASIKESVHKLVCDQIDALKVNDLFKITDHSITGVNGSEFIFTGLLRNVDQIKSTEGVDNCWVSEAHNVSDASWEILLPTIRKDDSEFYIDFNPRFEDDTTYQRWVVNAPVNCVSKLVNYSDNPYFPEVLRVEMEHDKAMDTALYEQKWLGKPLGQGGRVWPLYDPQVHVREFDDKLMAETGNFFMAMDPHQHYYPAVVFLCVFPMNQRKNWPEDFHFHFYDEWPGFDDLADFYYKQRKKLQFTGTLSDIAKHIYSHDGSDRGFKMRKRAIDTRFAKGVGGWSSSTQGIVSLYAKPENGGLIFSLPEEKIIDSQKEIINNTMTYNKFAPVNEFNQPQFSHSARCKNLGMSLKNHRLEESPSIGDRMTERENEKFKDFSDAMRICFASLETWKDPQKKPVSYNYSRGGSAFG